MALTPFTFRQSISDDFAAWLALVPHEMPMDANVMRQLPAVWATLLEDDALEARTITSLDAGRERVDAFGLSVFLQPGVFDGLVARPPRRIAETIYRAILAGDAPILRGRDIAKANADAGVDVCALHFCERPVDLNDPVGQQLLAMGHAAFRDAHMGHNIRALLHQNFRAPHKAFLLAGGMALFHEFEADGAGTEASVIVGMTRERSLAEPAGSPISFLFRTEPPRFFFAASERRVLQAALTGKSDSDIAAQLGVSRDAVKSAWKKVFRRVNEGAAPRQAPRNDSASWHRRALLEYVRQHPEELRPYQRPRR